MISYRDYFKNSKHHLLRGDLQYEVLAGAETALTLDKAMTPRPSETAAVKYNSNQIIIELRIDEANADSLPPYLRGGMSVDVVSLINHNINNQGIIEVKTYGWQATTPSHHQTFNLSPNLGEHIENYQLNSFLKLSERQNNVYRVQIEIHFLDGANSDPAFTVGRIWVGKAIRFQPNTGFDGNWEIGYTDKGSIAESIRGDVFAYERLRKRELSIPLRLVRKEQAIGGTDTVQEMLIDTGKTGEVIILPESDNLGDQFINTYGMIVNDPALSHYAGLFSTDLKVRQLL